MASTRQLIAEEARRRLQRITVANGFDTDAGQHVSLGVVVVLSSADASQAIAIDIQDVEIDEDSGFGDPRGQDQPLRMSMSVQAIASADLDQPWIAAEQVLSDIKKAMEDPDVDSWPDAVKDFGPGSPRDSTLEREEGSTFVGAAANYAILYLETWGSP